MKTSRLLMIVCSFFLVACGESCHKQFNDIELYGNTFIHIGDEDFQVPDSWKPFVSSDSNFRFMMPGYMKRAMFVEENKRHSTTLYSYMDSTKEGIRHFGIISVDLFHYEQGGFNSAKSYLSNSDEQTLFKPMIASNLKGGTMDKDMEVPDGEIINGPFYDSHLLDTNNSMFYAFDAYYRRKGHTVGEGPVSCHIFFLMNTYDAAMITVSYHDKDSTLFKDLFNVVKTCKWKVIY